uniref:Uncharacterized protein n=1 Tax=Anguilla anguilla TaxID=7936 RepID=A0A0E9RVE0_ANGAN
MSTYAGFRIRDC